MLMRRDRAMTAIAIVLDVALHAGRSTTVNAAEIGERLHQARRGIEPVLQALTRHGLLQGVRGPSGGYRLGRPPRDLALADIVAAANGEPDTAGSAGPVHTAVIAPLWDELDDLVTGRLAGLTVADLLVRAAKRGITRQVTEPLNFAI